MDKALVLFMVIVIVISIIISFFLVCYVIGRKQKKQELEVYTREQNKREDVEIWKFFIVFGLVFSMISATGLIVQTVRVKDWVKNPAVVSEMRTFGNGTKRSEYIFISYEFSGQTFENIDTSTSVKQRGAKNPIKVGQKIVILVNPDAPIQIVAFKNIYYGILIAMLVVGLLLCFVGIFNLINTRAGKSKWRTADEPPVVVAEEEERKSGIGVKIFVAALLGGILLFAYCLFSFRIFLFCVAWILFLAGYGIWINHKKKKQDGE